LTSAASVVAKSRSRLIVDETAIVVLPAWLSASNIVANPGQGNVTTPFRPRSDVVALSLATVVLRV